MQSARNLSKLFIFPFYTGRIIFQRRSFKNPVHLCAFGRRIQNRFLTTTAVKPVAEKIPVTVTFVTQSGKRHTVQGKVGDTLLDLVVNHQIPLDGYGACEGTLACSTCHVVLKKEDFAKLPDKPSDEEMDMLDLAYGLTDTSRLGCQIVLSPQLDGLEVIVPEGTFDARGDSK